MSDTGGKVSNYAGPVCEGHVFLSGFESANNILGGTCCFPTLQKSHSDDLNQRGSGWFGGAHPCIQ